MSINLVKYFMKKIPLFILCFILILPCLLVGCSAKATHYSEVIFELTDQQNTPVKNAKICFKKLDMTFITNDFGKTENIKIPLRLSQTEDWYGTIVTITAQGFVPLVIFNFILTYDQTRVAKIMLLFDDGTLPYCAYVEVPSNDAIKQILLS